MILSGHIINYDNLEFRIDNNISLNFMNNFIIIGLTNVRSDCDGNYVVVDITRSIVIRHGFAEVGFIRRWKKHTATSMLKDHKNRTTKFYSSYPSREVSKQVLLQGSLVKGVFEELSVRTGIGMKHVNIDAIVITFKWSEAELAHLDSLKGNRGRTNLKDKSIDIYAICLSLLTH